jgi:hypothetical protein
MNRLKLWPHLTIIAMAAALVAGLGVYFWMAHEQTASAQDLPFAARIQHVDGEVAFNDDLAKADANQQWTEATANQPFSEGDRIYTRENSHTSLAFSGRNFARLNPNTSLDCVSLGDRRTQLAMRDGSAMFDVGYLQPEELFEVATPNGAVDFTQPGLYSVGFDSKGGVLVSVLSGLAQVTGLGGTGQINKGEMLTLLGQTATELALSRLNNQDAGRQVDEYYRSQYPNSYDGRYSDYDAYLNEPNYYDPARRDVSYQYVSSNIPGINDLDYYGDWQNVAGYGNAWRPRVDSNWVPYQQGQWINNYPYGPTWVSSESWGYAPYHYGRWANVGNQWYWVPDAANTTPQYAPALVAFVSLNDSNQIGWVPLGPGDAYAPRYYDENWQPRYLSQANVSPERLRNFSIPGAVTVVAVDAFGRAIDPRNVRRLDQQRLASARTTLDPLTYTPLRNAVINSAWGRGKINLPPGIAKKLSDTPVYVGNNIRDSRFRRDLAKSMRVERVSDQARGQKFKVKDERENARQADNGRQQEIDQGRKTDLGRVTAEATKENVKDNKDAQRQARQQEGQLKQQQKKESRAAEQATRAAQRTQPQVPQPAQQQPKQEKAQRKIEQKAQGERVGKPAKAISPAKPPNAEVKQPAKGADKQERKQKPAAQPGGQEHGGGKGKAKKP